MSKYNVYSNQELVLVKQKGSRQVLLATTSYQCSEDNPEDTIKPRLQQAQADCDRIFFFSNGDGLTLDDDRLEDAITKLDVKLIIFDPIQSFIPAGSDMLNAVKMRTVMSKLAKTAEKCKCAVVLIGHLTKDASGKSIYRMLGSIDIVALARSVLMISRNADNPEIRVVSQIKNNLGPQGVNIYFELSKKDGFIWRSGAGGKKAFPTVLEHAKQVILNTIIQVFTDMRRECLTLESSAAA